MRGFLTTYTEVHLLFTFYSFTQGEWQTATERMSETAVLIEPPEGAVTRVNEKRKLQ